MKYGCYGLIGSGLLLCTGMLVAYSNSTICPTRWDGTANSQLIAEAMQAALDRSGNEFSGSLYQQENATVRVTTSNELCIAERAFLSNRLPEVKSALEDLLGQSLEGKTAPRIGLCFSGGGFRSMIMSLGFLLAAEETGLLDCVTYVSAISGATWAVAPWVASRKDVHDVITSIRENAQHGLDYRVGSAGAKCIIDTLLAKMYYRQPITAIDFYGPLLANNVLTELGDKRFTATLSETHGHIVDGDYPMPLYATIDGKENPYNWFEVTPFEIGSASLKSYVPTWSLGRTFSNGVSTNNAPEQTLGYMVGLLGSAFEVSLNDLIRYLIDWIKNKPSPSDSLYASLREPLICYLEALLDWRLEPSQLANFTYGMKTSPLKDKSLLSLIDAGIDFNLPLSALLNKERAVDIILVLDASTDIKGTPELRHACEYAQQHGYKVPPIDLRNADKKVISVFKDSNDPTCPIVIYFPRIKNSAYDQNFDPENCITSGYCSIFNFTYTNAQFDQLCGLSSFVLHQNIDLVCDAIREKIR